MRRFGSKDNDKTIKYGDLVTAMENNEKQHLMQKATMKLLNNFVQSSRSNRPSDPSNKFANRGFGTDDISQQRPEDPPCEEACMHEVKGKCAGNVDLKLTVAGTVLGKLRKSAQNDQHI